MDTSVKLYSLRLAEVRTYLFALLFIAGNILLPQLSHLIPHGGQILLPIYFFTLIAGYKYGYATGIMTALCSPLINHLLFGMPATEMLPVLLIKSSLLAVSAAFIANKTQKVSMMALAAVILFYQGIGMIAEFALTGSMTMAFQDIMIGYPGILIQLIGGFLILKVLEKF